jgi:hypothetical protein
MSWSSFSEDESWWMSAATCSLAFHHQLPCTLAKPRRFHDQAIVRWELMRLCTRFSSHATLVLEWVRYESWWTANSHQVRQLSSSLMYYCYFTWFMCNVLLQQLVLKITNIPNSGGGTRGLHASLSVSSLKLESTSCCEYHHPLLVGFYATFFVYVHCRSLCCINFCMLR